MEEKKSSKGKKSVFIMLLAVLLLTITIGFAALSATLSINGTSTIKGNTWSIDVGDGDIECPSGEVCTINPTNPENVDPDDGEVTPTNPNPTGAVIWMDGDTIYFKHVLSVPGDSFTFNATYTNNGSVDAKVGSVNIASLNSTAQSFLDYTATYANGNPVAVNDVLAAGASATFKITVSYKSSIQDLPTSEQLALINETAQSHTGASSSFTVNYVQQ